MSRCAAVLSLPLPLSLTLSLSLSLSLSLGLAPVDPRPRADLPQSGIGMAKHSQQSSIVPLPVQGASDQARGQLQRLERCCHVHAQAGRGVVLVVVYQQQMLAKHATQLFRLPHQSDALGRGQYLELLLGEGRRAQQE